MSAKRHDPESVWTPFGAFSMLAIQGTGQVVHLKGQVALDREGNVVGEGDMGAQVEQVLANIDAVLASVGGQMRDIFSLVHYSTDIEAFMGCGEIRARWFEAPWPVTTTLEVSRLYRPELMIEITASAEIPRERYRPPS